MIISIERMLYGLVNPNHARNDNAYEENGYERTSKAVKIICNKNQKECNQCDNRTEALMQGTKYRNQAI